MLALAQRGFCSLLHHLDLRRHRERERATHILLGLCLRRALTDTTTRWLCLGFLVYKMTIIIGGVTIIYTKSAITVILSLQREDVQGALQVQGLQPCSALSTQGGPCRARSPASPGPSAASALLLASQVSPAPWDEPCLPFRDERWLSGTHLIINFVSSTRAFDLVPAPPRGCSFHTGFSV